uniref:Uncharacterized protein n=1 Tax=Cacopsylla melanoneura TaxID=428564 RepID=A0A8D8VLP6_9HEMI
MIPKQSQTITGDLKYYTNIVTGQYFTCDQRNPKKIKLYTRHNKVLIGKETTSEILTETKINIANIIANVTMKHDYIAGGYYVDEKNAFYDIFFLKEIIKYQQLLLSLRSEVSLEAFSLTLLLVERWNE